MQPLGPLTVTFRAPRETVFDVIAAPYLGRTPRAMAAKEDFVEGDYVVYPTHGVGKVERIATEEIAGHRLEQPVERPQRGRLAGAVRPDHAGDAARPHLQRKALQDTNVAVVRHVDLAQGEQRRRFPPRFQPGGRLSFQDRPRRPPDWPGYRPPSLQR